MQHRRFRPVFLPHFDARSWWIDIENDEGQRGRMSLKYCRVLAARRGITMSGTNRNATLHMLGSPTTMPSHTDLRLFLLFLYLPQTALLIIPTLVD